MAFYRDIIQPKLIANLKAKKGSFVISLTGATRDADVVVGGQLGVVPNSYYGSPMKFVREEICQKILNSQFKFERFEVRWNPEALPNLNTDKDG